MDLIWFDLVLVDSVSVGENMGLNLICESEESRIVVSETSQDQQEVCSLFIFILYLYLNWVINFHQICYELVLVLNVGGMQCNFSTSFRGIFDWYNRWQLWAIGEEFGGIKREREGQGKGGIWEVEFLHERFGGTNYEAQFAGKIWHEFHMTI